MFYLGWLSIMSQELGFCLTTVWVAIECPHCHSTDMAKYGKLPGCIVEMLTKLLETLVGVRSRSNQITNPQHYPESNDCAVYRMSKGYSYLLESS